MRSCFFAVLLLSNYALYGDSLPGWFVSLRDAVYEQRLRADEIVPLYREASQRAAADLTGRALYTALSRCEYMMGRGYQFEERKEEAAACYEKGTAWAEKSLETAPSAEGWRMLAENISQSCVVKSVSYVMAYGLKVERFSKNALKLDPRNAAALYMTASRWIYAPVPFNNYPGGIRMMEDILKENEGTMERDDRFYVYSAIAYAYMQQRKYQEARSWLEKSLTVYPTNKFAGDMLKKTFGNPAGISGGLFRPEEA
jgi:tetratricopeptide (TPR) repeat protein